jgi:hypothetical protein
MRLLLSFLCLCGALSVGAQPGFYSMIDDTCAAGGDILRPTNWTIYQTVENTWDGAQDTTVCPSFLSNSDIDLTTVDVLRPVFIRTVDWSEELDPNRLYSINLSSDWGCWDFGIEMGDTEFCNNDFCNGSMVRIQIPPAPGDSVPGVRVHQQEFINALTDEVQSSSDYTMCFPSEKFEEQTLKEVIFKFNFIEGIPQFPLWSQGLNMASESGIGQEQVEWYRWQQDSYHFESWGEGPNSTLFLHEAEGYPSIENKGYLDFTLDPNVDTVSNVYLFFDESTTYSLQPFTYFRGGLVDGSDSLRHTLNVINEGATVCFNAYIDVIINRDWTYEHRGGKLEFQGGRSCLQFNEGGKFIISNNSKLEYGMFGKGMLALYNGCQIDIQSGSELLINNTVILEDHNWAPLGASIDVPLVEGARLTFGPYSRIENWSTEEATKLRVFMLGGQVDLSGLSEADKQHVKLIFPETAEDELVIFGNPVVDELHFFWPAPSEEPISIEVYDLSGKSVFKTLQEPLPSQQQTTPLAGMSSGNYVVVVGQGNVLRTGRVFLAKQKE